MRRRAWIPPAPSPPTCAWQLWSREETDVLSALQLIADDYRNRHKIYTEWPVEVLIPNHLARRLIEGYGSLEAAADATFMPGSVRLVDAYWREFSFQVRESVERHHTQLSSGCDVDDLTRIALGAA